MTRAHCLGLIGALSLFFGAFGPAFANAGLNAQLPVQVVGTDWKGQENLGNFGALTFQFREGQRVTMIDAQSTTTGNFSQNDASVTIQFANCVYEGTINGNVLSGTARFTSGTSAGVTWTWSVERQAQ